MTISPAGGKPANTTAASVTVAKTLNPPNKAKPEAIAAWREALKDGMGYKHVAESFGVSITVVRKYLPGMGWTHQQVIEHAALLKQHKKQMAKVTYV